jgi:hypothetical protein
MQAQSSLSVASVQKTGWEVQLSAGVGNKTDVDNVFGYSAYAMNVESPGYLENYIDLFFVGDNGKAMAYDLRPSVIEGESWPFKVSTDQTQGLVQITWAGLESLPAGKVLTLVDETAGKSVVMTPAGVYMFPASEGSRAFRVTFGSK